MNTTPDSTSQPTPQSTPQPSPPPASGFFAWIRGLGIVRGSDRWFAGVAGGVATKAGIDPLIVRGIFVVLALLGGPGILLYLAGWLLLPDFTGKIRLEELFRGRGEGWTVVALVAVVLMAVPTLLNLFTPGSFGWTLAPWGVFGLPGWLSGTVTWLVWIGIIVFASIWISRTIRTRGAVHLGREQPGEQPSQQSDTRSGAPGHTFDEKADAWGDDFSRRADAWGDNFSKKADAWGEDFSRRTDEWSARYTKRHEALKLGSAHVIITLALALLAAGAAALWAVSTGVASTGGSVFVAGLIAATAVLSISLILAGIRGKNTGWIGFLAACGVIALLFTSVFPTSTRFQPFGTMDVDGSTDRGAVQIAGNMPIDLTGLDEAGSRANADLDLTVWQFAGGATVMMPDSHPTIVTVRMFAGSITEQRNGEKSGRTSGPFVSRTISANLNAADGPSSITRVSITMFAGNVNVLGPDGKQRADAKAEDSTTQKRDETSGSSAENTMRKTTAEELTRLEDKLALLEWKLDEPGLSKADQRSLEADRAQLKQDIKDLELEAAQ